MKIYAVIFSSLDKEIHLKLLDRFLHTDEVSRFQLVLLISPSYYGNPCKDISFYLAYKETKQRYDKYDDELILYACGILDKLRTI